VVALRLAHRTDHGLVRKRGRPWLLGWLAGTPLLPPLLRLFGARMGRRVYLDTTWLTEFDLVVIGDDAAIGAWTSLQTHLFEDRVMKMSTLVVGARCNRRAALDCALRCGLGLWLCLGCAVARHERRGAAGRKSLAWYSGALAEPWLHVSPLR